MLWITILLFGCAPDINCGPDGVEVNGECLSATNLEPMDASTREASADAHDAENDAVNARNGTLAHRR